LAYTGTKRFANGYTGGNLVATLLTMPRLSQDMESGTIVDWLKREGDRVERGQVILVVETDKAESDVEAPESGVIRRILAPVGTQVPIGEPLAVIAAESEQDWEKALPGANHEPAATAAPTPPTATATPATAAHAAAPAGGRQPASPAARRVAKELGVDIALVAGTGEGGLVSEADVRAFAEISPSGSAPAGQADAADDDIERIPLVGMRKRIADRMTLSRHSAADVTTVIDVDMDPVARVRKQTGLSYTTYVAWAVAHTLPEFPDVNATFVDETILRRRHVNLGVAVALESGLIVPVVRSAETMTPEQIDAEVQRLAALARDGKIAPADLSGGSFTLTNSGTYGSLFFTPIINVPEVAILGVGRVADVPVVRDGQVVPGKVMYLCLSYDHRVVDGATAVQFLAAVKRRLQEIETGMSR
jgi:pyruvate dehydrogenase E2 component (dihydrolipoamide acetyltransferase)